MADGTLTSKNSLQPTPPLSFSLARTKEEISKSKADDSIAQSVSQCMSAREKQKILISLLGLKFSKYYTCQFICQFVK